MIRTKAVLAAETNCIQEIYKAQIKKIREKYKVELATLKADFFYPYLRLISSLFLGGVLKLSKSQLPPINSNLSSSIHIIFFDSDLKVKDILFDVDPKLSSSTL